MKITPLAAAPAVSELDREIDVLVARTRSASGSVIKLLNMGGGAVESFLKTLPDEAQEAVSQLTRQALEQAFNTAGRVNAASYLPETGTWANRATATLSGAVGGFGGLASSIVEIPITVTNMLAMMQKVARTYGFDPDEPEVRAQCLMIFGTGGPLSEDDGVDTAFLTTRLATDGLAVKALVSKVAPRVALVLSEKLAAQVLPVLGAATGAMINLTFMTYYEEMAHVRFGLLRLARTSGENLVRDRFEAAVARDQAARRSKKSSTRNVK